MGLKAEKVLERLLELHRVDPSSLASVQTLAVRYPKAWLQLAEVLEDDMDWTFTALGATLSLAEAEDLATYLRSNLTSTSVNALSRSDVIAVVLNERKIAAEAAFETYRKGLSSGTLRWRMTGYPLIAEASSYGLGVPIYSRLREDGTFTHHFYENEDFLRTDSIDDLELDHDDKRWLHMRTFERLASRARELYPLHSHMMTTKTRFEAFRQHFKTTPPQTAH